MKTNFHTTLKYYFLSKTLCCIIKHKKTLRLQHTVHYFIYFLQNSMEFSGLVIKKLGWWWLVSLVFFDLLKVKTWDSKDRVRSWGNIKNNEWHVYSKYYYTCLTSLIKNPVAIYVVVWLFLFLALFSKKFSKICSKLLRLYDKSSVTPTGGDTVHFQSVKSFEAEAKIQIIAKF